MLSGVKMAHFVWTGDKKEKTPSLLVDRAGARPNTGSINQPVSLSVSQDAAATR